MKRIAVVLALSLAVPAWAQDQKPAPKEPEKKEQTRVAKKPNPKRQEDARHCLEKATNTEIIKCSEEYL
jgi:hypothetical protein